MAPRCRSCTPRTCPPTTRCTSTLIVTGWSCSPPRCTCSTPPHAAPSRCPGAPAPSPHAKRPTPSPSTTKHSVLGMTLTLTCTVQGCPLLLLLRLRVRHGWLPLQHRYGSVHHRSRPAMARDGDAAAIPCLGTTNGDLLQGLARLDHRRA